MRHPRLHPSPMHLLLVAALAAGCEGQSIDTSGAALSLGASDGELAGDPSADQEADAIDTGPIAEPLGALFAEIAPLRPHCFEAAARCASEGDRPYRCATAALRCAMPEQRKQVRQAIHLCAPPPPEGALAQGDGPPDEDCKDSDGRPGPKGMKGGEGKPQGDKPPKGPPPQGDDQDGPPPAKMDADGEQQPPKQPGKAEKPPMDADETAELEAIAAMSPDERQAACKQALEDLIAIAATMEKPEGPPQPGDKGGPSGDEDGDKGGDKGGKRGPPPGMDVDQDGKRGPPPGMDGQQGGMRGPPPPQGDDQDGKRGPPPGMGDEDGKDGKGCHPCHSGLDECLSLQVGAIGCFVELSECLVNEPLPEPEGGPGKGDDGEGMGPGKRGPPPRGNNRQGPPPEA